MATLTLQKLRVVGGAQQGDINDYPEAATQTFKEGQLVYLASGNVTEVTADGVVIWGIALEDAHNDASAGDHRVQVQKLFPGCRLMGNVYKTGDLTASLATDAIVGNKYPISVQSNITVVDIHDQTTPSAVIIARVKDDDDADVYGRVIFTFLNAVLQTQIGA
jgi:hypothetical protein